MIKRVFNIFFLFILGVQLALPSVVVTRQMGDSCAANMKEKKCCCAGMEKEEQTPASCDLAFGAEYSSCTCGDVILSKENIIVTPGSKDIKILAVAKLAGMEVIPDNSTYTGRSFYEIDHKSQIQSDPIFLLNETFLN